MTMTQAADTAVRQEIVVNAPIERAFNVFTEGYQTWNPPEHHIGEAELESTVMEPREDGRWYEVGVDGSECDWGFVTAWEPPHRLLLAWHLTPEYEFDPDPARATEVEIRFTPRDGGTLVELEHRGFEKHAESGAGMRDAVSAPGGWNDLLALYANAF